MIKVLVVDDEPPIARSIKLLIEASGMDFEVAACAYHGKEAISLIEALKPDLLITDIQMPVMDGLELLAYVSKKHPEIVSVILTGFQEFEYARKALQMGVLDYLLKPVTAVSIKEILTKVETLNWRKWRQHEQGYLQGLIKGESLPDLAHTRHFDYKNYILLLVCAGAFNSIVLDDLSPAREFWSHLDIKTTINGMVPEDIKVWVTEGKSDAEYYVLLATNQGIDNIQPIASRLEAALNQGKLAITVLISPLLHDIKDISASSQELRVNLIRLIKFGVSQTIQLSRGTKINAGIDAELLSIDSKFEKSLIHSMQKGVPELFKSELQMLFEHWEKYQYPQLLIERLLKLLVMECYKSLNDSQVYDLADLEMELNQGIASSCSYKDLFDGIWYIFEGLFKAKDKEALEKEDHTVIIKKVEAYLKENYIHPITHQTLADIFGYAPSYLSKLFKGYIGLSPSEYLTSLRMERAKEMMDTQSGMLTKDIAEMVGYADPHYFSRIFKKEIGVWPSEYQNTQK